MENQVNLKLKPIELALIQDCLLEFNIQGKYAQLLVEVLEKISKEAQKINKAVEEKPPESEKK